MSASQRPGKNSPDTTREEPPDINAYAIDIPEGFVAAYPAADTVAEALRRAEQAPAHDADTVEHAECPRCSSRRLSPKSSGTQDTKLTEGYVCETCRTHVSDPEHPETAEIVFSDNQTQLGRWADE
jgi:DNA-directed RNA polymerase subunit RPC12/RpoP